jgi:hypothetical protein
MKGLNIRRTTRYEVKSGHRSLLRAERRHENLAIINLTGIGPVQEVDVSFDKFELERLRDGINKILEDL